MAAMTPMQARRTEKEDWLTAAFAALPRTFASGLPETSFRMQVPGYITLRGIAHFPPDEPPPLEPEQRESWLPSKYVMMTLFIVVELPTIDDVKGFKIEDHPAIRLMRQSIGDISSIDVACVVFESLGKPETGTELFKVSHPALNLLDALIRPDEYANQLNRIRSPQELRDPKVKDVTASVNDAFAWWSRKYLSPQLSINDLDIVHALRPSAHNKGAIILELKRSRKNDWKPYLDDLPNFMLIEAVSRCLHARWTIVRYAEQENCVADVFTITSMDREAVTGWRKRLQTDSAEEMANNLLGTFDLIAQDCSIQGGQPYTSSYFRLPKYAPPSRRQRR